MKKASTTRNFFMFTDAHQPLVGHGVILSTTDDAGEAPCTLSLDWVKERAFHGSESRVSGAGRKINSPSPKKKNRRQQ
jgi:hypothetical protein